MEPSDKLKRFVEANPQSELEELSDGGFQVKRPWGDDTLVLEDRDGAGALAEALEHLVLPRQFSAVCHCDSSEVEFVWTYVPPDYRLMGREFRFFIGGGEVACGWRAASDRLLTIARHARPVGPPSGTEHRNLPLFHSFQSASLPQEIAQQVKALRPISFWMSPAPIGDDEAMVRLAKHLNFFMKYYDRDSPTILIHSSSRPETPLTVLPLLLPTFPAEIHSRPIDPLLLDFALAADMVAEARLKFIYYYQILEYAAFYAIGEKAKADVLKLLRSPDVQANAENYVERVLDTLVDPRLADEPRLERVIQERASPERIWREVDANREYFASAQAFEGGFEMEPCVSTDTSLESFKAMWGTKIPSVLKRIRNALVHGRESRSNAVIAPTQGNDILLRPWIPVIRRVAEDIIIYEG